MTMMICKQAHASLLHIPIKFSLLRRRPQKDKVVVVMGATGTGKSRLSIDLARRFPAEVVNADKMQVYQGLDITTNKITDQESNCVPHHLIGIADPDSDFSAGDFVRTSSLAVESIVGRGKLPVITGGSNSFIEALVDDKGYEFRSRYDVCFLWIDVEMAVLKQYVSDRVDRMVEAGMVEEVRRMYNPSFDYSKGIRRAIGVPEFDAFFRSEYSSSVDHDDDDDDKTRNELLESAISNVKMNTFTLACRQLRKIHRLRTVKGWKLHRIDATKVFESKFSDHAWSELVAAPGAAIVREFIHNHSRISSRFARCVIGEYERRPAEEAAAAVAGEIVR